MARTKPKLNDALDDLAAAPAPAPVSRTPARSGPGRKPREEKTSLVGAQLGARYSRSLNMLSAETGKPNRVLMEEALDMLFTKYGARIINV